MHRARRLVELSPYVDGNLRVVLFHVLSGELHVEDFGGVVLVRKGVHEVGDVLGKDLVEVGHQRSAICF